jgi:hypothetical protein
VTEKSGISGPTAVRETVRTWQNGTMKSHRTHMSAVHFRGNPAHVALLNQIWDRTDLSPDGLPGVTTAESEAYAAAVRAIRRVDLAAEGVAGGHPTNPDALRIAALVVELARRYPAVLLYPGRLLETAWPVLVQAQAQGMLHGVDGWAAMRRVVGAAATAVTSVLAGPRASWWQPFEGHWLWASTTLSKTTGLPLPAGPEHPAPLAG